MIGMYSAQCINFISMYCTKAHFGLVSIEFKSSQEYYYIKLIDSLELKAASWREHRPSNPLSKGLQWALQTRCPRASSGPFKPAVQGPPVGPSNPLSKGLQWALQTRCPRASSGPFKPAVQGSPVGPSNPLSKGLQSAL